MSWIKPKPAHQSILSLILITVGLALLIAFILFLPDQLAVARTPGSIINSLGLQLHLLLCCGPHPSPFYHHLCSDVWVDCHDWDQGYHWSPWEFIFSLTHPPPAFVHGGDPSLPPCHWCPALTAMLRMFGANLNKLSRKVQTQWIYLGFRLCYGDRLKYLAPNRPLVCWKQNFNCVVTTLTLLHHRTAAL